VREVLAELLSIFIVAAICISVVASASGPTLNPPQQKDARISILKTEVSGGTIKVYLYNYGERDVTIVSAYVGGQSVPFTPTTIKKDSYAIISLQVPPSTSPPFSFTLETSDGAVINGVAS